MPAKKPTKRVQTTKSKNSKTTKSSTRINPANQYDRPRNLVVGGIIGVILFYTIISRALNTGSYWEYFFALAILFMSIRLFIRSIRLN